MLNINNVRHAYRWTKGHIGVSVPSLTQGFTVEMWLRWNGTSLTPLVQFTAAGIEYVLSINPDATFGFTGRASVDEADDNVLESEQQIIQHESARQIVPGTWTHVALTVARKDVQAELAVAPVWIPTLHASLIVDAQPELRLDLQSPDHRAMAEGPLDLVFFNSDDDTASIDYASLFVWQGIASIDKIRLRRNSLYTDPHRLKIFAAYHDATGKPVHFPEDEQADSTGESFPLDDDTVILPDADPDIAGGAPVTRKIAHYRNQVISQMEQLAHERRQQAYKQQRVQRLARTREMIRRANKESYEYIGFIKKGVLKKLQDNQIVDFFTNQTTYGIASVDLVGTFIDEVDEYTYFYTRDQVFVFDRKPEHPELVTSWHEDQGNQIQHMELQQTSQRKMLVTTFSTHVLVREIEAGSSKTAFTGAERQMKHAATASIQAGFVFSDPFDSFYNVVTKTSADITITRVKRSSGPQSLELRTYEGSFTGISDDRNIVFNRDDFYFLNLSQGIRTSALQDAGFAAQDIEQVRFSPDNRFAAIIANGAIHLYELGDEFATLGITQVNIGDVPTESYVLKPGETLYSVARKKNVSVGILASMNNIKDPSQVQPGQRILVPQERAVEQVKQTYRAERTLIDAFSLDPLAAHTIIEDIADAFAEIEDAFGDLFTPGSSGSSGGTGSEASTTPTVTLSRITPRVSETGVTKLGDSWQTHYPDVVFADIIGDEAFMILHHAEPEVDKVIAVPLIRGIGQNLLEAPVEFPFTTGDSDALLPVEKLVLSSNHELLAMRSQQHVTIHEVRSGREIFAQTMVAPVAEMIFNRNSTSIILMMSDQQPVEFFFEDRYLLDITHNHLSGDIYVAQDHIQIKGSAKTAAISKATDTTLQPIFLRDERVHTLALTVSSAEDDAHNDVYWIEGNGNIYKGTIDGASYELLYPNVPVGRPGHWQIVVDIQRNYLYWTNGREIWRAPTATSNRAVRPHVYISHAESPYPIDLAVDFKTGWLFWQDRDLQRIRRYQLDDRPVGGNPVDEKPIDDLYAAPIVREGLALDSITRHLFWNAYHERLEEAAVIDTQGLFFWLEKRGLSAVTDHQHVPVVKGWARFGATWQSTHETARYFSLGRIQRLVSELHDNYARFHEVVRAIFRSTRLASINNLLDSTFDAEGAGQARQAAFQLDALNDHLKELQQDILSNGTNRLQVRGDFSPLKESTWPAHTDGSRDVMDFLPWLNSIAQGIGQLKDQLDISTIRGVVQHKWFGEAIGFLDGVIDLLQAVDSVDSDIVQSLSAHKSQFEQRIIADPDLAVIKLTIPYTRDLIFAIERARQTIEERSQAAGETPAPISLEAYSHAYERHTDNAEQMLRNLAVAYEFIFMRSLLDELPMYGLRLAEVIDKLTETHEFVQTHTGAAEEQAYLTLDSAIGTARGAVHALATEYDNLLETVGIANIHTTPSNALVFDGNQHYAALGALYLDAVNGISIEIRFRSPARDSAHTLLELSNGFLRDNLKLTLLSDGRIQCMMAYEAGELYSRTSMPVVLDDTWHYLVFCADDVGLWRLYLDGAPVPWHSADQVSKMPYYALASRLRTGLRTECYLGRQALPEHGAADQITGGFFQGEISMVRCWNMVLDAEAIDEYGYNLQLDHSEAIQDYDRSLVPYRSGPYLMRGHLDWGTSVGIDPEAQILHTLQSEGGLIVQSHQLRTALEQRVLLNDAYRNRLKAVEEMKQAQQLADAEIAQAQDTKGKLLARAHAERSSAVLRADQQINDQETEAKQRRTTAQQGLEDEVTRQLDRKNAAKSSADELRSGADTDAATRRAKYQREEEGIVAPARTDLQAAKRERSKLP